MKEILDNFEFGEFRIDGLNKRLTKAGEPIPLTPKVFETLYILVSNAGNLVEKAELMDLIWPDRFVEESNLTFNIKMLRKALCDSSSDPKFIETVPRRGYRFIAPLSINVQTADTDLIPRNVPERKRSTRAIVISATFVLLGGVFLGGFVIWQKLASSAAVIEDPFVFSTSKLTDSGNIYQSAISPDGRTIVYTSLVNGKESVWLRNLETSANVQLLAPSNDSYFAVSFSPDGHTVFFIRGPKDSKHSPAIYKVDAAGGIPVKLVERSEGALNISPDGNKILFIRYDIGSGDKNKLFEYDLQSKEERTVSIPEIPNVFFGASYSPDGKQLVVAYGQSNTYSRDVRLYTMDAAGGHLEPISPKFFYVAETRWMSADKGILFTASESIGDSSKIWLLEPKTMNVRPLSDGSISYGRLSCSKNCVKIVANTFKADFRLYGGSQDVASVPRELTQARDGFAFTPDGRIIFASDSAATEDIWIMKSDGSDQRQLTTSSGHDAYPRVSSDGRLVAFTSNRSGNGQVWRMNIDGTEQIQLTKEKGGAPIAFSNDGNWIFYSEATTRAIWKVSSNGSDERPVFEQKLGYEQALSPDCLTIASLARDKQTRRIQVRLFDAETGTEQNRFEIAKSENIPFALKFSVDGNSITYVAENFDGENSLWQQDLKGSKPTQLTRLGRTSVMDAEVSPDGLIRAFIQGQWKHDAVLLVPGK